MISTKGLLIVDRQSQSHLHKNIIIDNKNSIIAKHKDSVVTKHKDSVAK